MVTNSKGEKSPILILWNAEIGKNSKHYNNVRYVVYSRYCFYNVTSKKTELAEMNIKLHTILLQG